jgi:hypothetical protein
VNHDPNRFSNVLGGPRPFAFNRSIGSRPEGSAPIVTKAPASSLSGYDRFITIFITAAIMLEWSTTYFFNINPEVFSFSKFVVLPLIGLDFFIRYNRYLTRECITYGVMLAFGYALVTLAPSSETFYDEYVVLASFKLLPNVFVLIFYVACNTERELALVLRTAFLASLVVVGCMLLAYVGILAPVDNINEGNVTRITAGTSWSSLPLFLTFPAATIGGILLNATHRQLRPTYVVFAVSVCLASFFASLLAGQRTSAGLIIICLVISGLLFLRNLSWRNYLGICFAILMTVVIYWQFDQQFSFVGQTLLNRTTNSEAGGMEGDMSDRASMYQTLFDVLLNHPSFKPPGVGFFIQQNGNIPHLILGEAYCYGGLGLLFVMIYIFVRAWTNTVKRWDARRKSSTGHLHLALMVILLGFSVTLSFHPGLHTRMVYLILGVCLAKYRPTQLPLTNQGWRKTADNRAATSFRLT